MVESKNAAVVRKHLGTGHIPARFAETVNDFAQHVLSPYLNFHRPCLFAREHVDAKGKIRKTYPSSLDWKILAQQAPEVVRNWAKAERLTLHPDKTRIGDCQQEGQGFEFLGYSLEAGQRWVRPKSQRALKDRIRQKTRRIRGQSLERIIADLDPMLRGWYGYFQHAHRWTFPSIDGFVRRRLRAILRKQDKRPGFGRCYAGHRRWPTPISLLPDCSP